MKRKLKQWFNMIFKRNKAYITLEYIHDYSESNLSLILKSYNIYIQKGKREWVIENLSPYSTKSIIDALRDAHKAGKNLKLVITNNSINEFIIIPKWATKDLAQQILNCVGYRYTENKERR